MNVLAIHYNISSLRIQGPLSDCKDDELPPKSINLLFLEGGEIVNFVFSLSVKCHFYSCRIDVLELFVIDLRKEVKTITHPLLLFFVQDVYKKIGKEEFMEMFSNETFVKASNTCSSINFDLKTT